MTTSAAHYSRDLQRYYRLPAIQVSLTLVLSLFIVATFIVFALGPTVVAIVSLRKNIIDSEKTLKTLDAKIVTLQTITKQFDSLKSILPILNLNVPNIGAQYGPLAGTIETLAQQTGVELHNETIGPTLLYSRILSPFTPNKGQKVVTLPITIRVSGSYPAVMTFLTQLLSIDRLIALDTISISKEVSSKTAATIVTLNVSGSAYYLADEAQLAKALPDKKGSK